MSCLHQRSIVQSIACCLLGYGDSIATDHEAMLTILIRSIAPDIPRNCLDQRVARLAGTDCAKLPFHILDLCACCACNVDTEVQHPRGLTKFCLHHVSDARDLSTQKASMAICPEVQARSATAPPHPTSCHHFTPVDPQHPSHRLHTTPLHLPIHPLPPTHPTIIDAHLPHPSDTCSENQCSHRNLRSQR